MRSPSLTIQEKHLFCASRALSLWSQIRLCLIVFLLTFVGCAAPQPVLYPNDHLKRVGESQAERDIAECRALAERYTSSHTVERIAGHTAIGAATGAATGAVGGAVSGGSAGTGAAVGGATGATYGFLRGLFSSTKPSPTYRNFVNRCLKERGYEPIGWE
ncbi:MAG: hypothetical protein D6690_10385 [Nitrospirae bacterium]|nr:MAG: hypothetical protein D6690_10385 [Nitrospirota bacterium]